MKPVAASVDAYIDSFSPEKQQLLRELRAQIQTIVPQAQESISYGMPAYKLNGALVYFGATNTHIGFYPTSTGIAAFTEQLTAYSFSKGVIRFSFNQPLPLDLIADIVRFRVEENQAKAAKERK